MYFHTTCTRSSPALHRRGFGLGSEMLLSASDNSLTPPSTSDWIAIGAIVLAVIGAVIAYRQLKAGHAQLTATKNTARAQFLLNMDQAFEADKEIRVRLARANQPSLTAEEWRDVKRYMARFERVFVFVSQGLLDPAVVYRLYGARFRNIVMNQQIRERLLEGDKAASWVDFIQLWQKLDEMAKKATGKPLCDGVKLATVPTPPGGGEVVATEEFEVEK